MAVLAGLLLACLGSLPYTFGKDASGEPRYNAGDLAWARMGPWWAGGEKAMQREAGTGGTPVLPAAGETAARPWFWLGSDTLGRSELMRCLAGGGVSLVVGLAAAGIGVLIGTMYGAVSGFAGGRVDGLMMRVVDVLYGLPYILLVVLLAVATDAVVSELVSRSRARGEWVTREAMVEIGSPGHAATLAEAMAALARDPVLRGKLDEAALVALPPRQISATTRGVIDLGTLLAAIAGVSWLTMARVIRGQVLALKNREFVLAARAIGLSPWRVLVRHIAPNLWGTVLVYGALTVPQAMLQEAFLSFLGIGVKPPMPSWGSLAGAGLQEINPVDSSWWLIVFPCVLLAATLLALNFVGESLRRSLDPNGRGR